MELFSAKRAEPSGTTNRDDHCRRVGALAKEVSRFFTFRSGETLVESLAWLHDCPSPLVSGPVEIYDGRGNAPPQSKGYSLGDQIVTGVRILRGEQPGSGESALAAEIVAMSHSFDEMIEWLQFENQTVSQLQEELTVIADFSGCRPEVGAALRLVSKDLMADALQAGEQLPISAISAVRRLLAIPADRLTVEALSDTAGQDPALAADLLRVVNSWAHPTLRRQISSIQQAVIRLGTEQARNVLWSSASRCLFASKEVHRLWKHSLRVATVAADLGEWSGCDRNEAFLAGLLHDVGLLAIEKLDRPTLRIRSRLLEQGIPTVWVDLVTCWHDHGEIGGSLLQAWDLPQSLVDAVAFHHFPERSKSRLASVLYLAERQTKENEDGFSGVKTAHAMETTGLSLADVSQAGAGGQETLESILAG